MTSIWQMDVGEAADEPTSCARHAAPDKGTVSNAYPQWQTTPACTQRLHLSLTAGFAARRERQLLRRPIRRHSSLWACNRALGLSELEPKRGQDEFGL